MKSLSRSHSYHVRYEPKESDSKAHVSNYWIKGEKSKSVSHSVMSDSLWPHGLWPAQAPLSIEFLQARILEWVVIPFSRESSWPRTEPGSPALQTRLSTIWATREAQSLNLKLPLKWAALEIDFNQHLPGYASHFIPITYYSSYLEGLNKHFLN